MRRLLLPVLASASAAAADLPITGITVLPGGLVMERGGTMPAGDGIIIGLPAAIDEGSLTVEVAGREIAGWRLVHAAGTPSPAPDGQARQRLAAAEHAVQSARLRTELAGAALQAPDQRPAPERLPRLPSPMPGPEAIRAQIAFAAANAEQGANEAQVAAEAADGARNACLAAPAAEPAAPMLAVPGAAGREVRVRYLVPGAHWTPAWRLEVDGVAATLVQLAVIEISVSGSLPPVPVPVTVATRGRADAALLGDPQVPLIGLREAMETEAPWSSAARRGASSESAVGGGLGALSRVLMQGGGYAAVDAEAALAFLGAGYDHRTPNKYRAALQAGLARLTALEPDRLELPVLALATSAIAEAYAMTQDGALRPRAQAFLDQLRARWPNELPSIIIRRGPLSGPEAALLVVQAMKSCSAANLAVGEDLHALRDGDLGQGEEAELAHAAIAAFTGGPAPIVDMAAARRWAAACERWWDGAHTECIAMAVQAAFQTGGEAWRLIEGTVRSRLMQLQIQSGAEAGLWPLSHHPLGRYYGSAQAIMCLEVYYRYRQLASGQAASSGDAAPESRPAPSAPAWPLRLAAAGEVALVNGRQVVELRRARLASAISWQALPLQSPGVWRHLSAVNPWNSPLPGGPVEVVADGRCSGLSTLAATAPGAVIDLDLGPDERLRVRRTVHTATDDGLFKRTLTMTVTCRLEAPPGFAETVRVREPLPRPEGEQIAIAIVRPAALSGEDYARLLARDGQVTATMSAAQPETVIAELTLTYPRSVRPRLEVR